MNGKIMRRGKFAALALSVALLLCPMVQAAPAVSAASALLMDAQTGRILYEQNADQLSLIASTTKIMTGFLVAETCDPDQVVTIPAEACGIEGSSLYLKPGERWTVEALLYGMMLHSGNDAAVALAMTCSGSVPAFVAQMNEKAAALELQQTHFANPNGLDDEGNYSTARDLAKLARAALQNPLFAKVVSTKSISVGERCLTNHNKMLRMYDGADGVKTGFTKAAGRILVSSATKNGRQLIAVTIHAPDDWNDHAKLMDYGFESYQLKTLLQSGQLVCELAVVGGQDGNCNVLSKQTLSYPVTQSDRIHIKIQAPDFLYAPIARGDVVGKAQIYVGDYVIGTCELVAATDVPVEQKEKPHLWQRILGA